MRLLDQIFILVFARYRRKLGDLNIESAWRQATNRVCGYFVFPVAAVTLVLIVVAYSFMGTGTSGEQKQTGQIAAGVAVVVLFYLLDRRFRKYLSLPPTLSSLEGASDARVLLWVRLVSVGVFAFTSFAGFLLHRAGYL